MRPTNTDTQEIERAIEGEQAADLAALQAQANPSPAPGETTGTGGQVAEQGPAEPSAQAVQVATLAVGMMRPMVAYVVPSLRAAPDELWEPIPAGVAGILDHYGIGMDALANPWARLAISCAPLAAFAAVEAMKEAPKKEPAAAADVLDLAASQPAAAEPAQAGQKTVTFGAPAPAGGTA